MRRNLILALTKEAHVDKWLTTEAGKQRSTWHRLRIVLYRNDRKLIGSTVCSSNCEVTGNPYIFLGH